MKERIVKPEILDTLSPEDPAALANRRDLRRINRLQGNGSWIASTLRRHLRPGDAVLEAGAGDGSLGRDLERLVPVLESCRYTGLDLRHDRPEAWPGSWGWQRSDLQDCDFIPPPRALIVNFLLHQFGDDELARLGHAIRNIPVWVLCEPHRSPHALAGLALLRVFGLHDVSWHDGRVSVRAGFRGRELAELLGADEDRRTHVAIDLRGVYRMVSVAPGRIGTRGVEA